MYVNVGTLSGPHTVCGACTIVLHPLISIWQHCNHTIINIAPQPSASHCGYGCVLKIELLDGKNGMQTIFRLASSRFIYSQQQKLKIKTVHFRSNISDDLFYCLKFQSIFIFFRFLFAVFFITCMKDMKIFAASFGRISCPTKYINIETENILPIYINGTLILYYIQHLYIIYTIYLIFFFFEETVAQN